jgi:hypothetical protein
LQAKKKNNQDNEQASTSSQKKNNVGRGDGSLYESDPRAYRKMRQRQDYSVAKQEVQKRNRDERASNAFNLPEQPLVRTLGGGTAMIFAMAQRMFDQQQQQQQQSEASVVAKPPPVPRWRPAAGIANDNPSFRTTSPDMNHQGYAGVIWRNVRKRNKASLWRYALRTYDRMGGTGAGPTDDLGVLRPTNIHHEGALLATAKLGLYERALEIYATVELEGSRSRRPRAQRPDLAAVQVTDRMVQSVVRACVRTARSAKASTISSRRQPLDAARTILQELEEKHGIPLDARHVNPLAAAYQAVGLRPESAALLQLLGDRVIGPEPETGSQRLNINDFGAKDKASYALLIEGAVLDADWGAAVENLTTMTDAGLFPLDRHLHTWTEISNRKAKHRTTRSWKKKRDQTWLRTVQP